MKSSSFQNVPDCAETDFDDIIMKLPTPFAAGGTEQAVKGLVFGPPTICLDSYASELAFIHQEIWTLEEVNCFWVSLINDLIEVIEKIS